MDTSDNKSLCTFFKHSLNLPKSFSSEEEENTFKDAVAQYKALLGSTNTNFVTKWNLFNFGDDEGVIQTTRVREKYEDLVKRQKYLIAIEASGFKQNATQSTVQGYNRNSHLNRYSVPKYFYDKLETKKIRLNYPLEPRSYVARFKTLLFTEEVHQRIDMRRYDQFNVKLEPRGSKCVLPVPGLAEGRPSLMRGDRVMLMYAEGKPCLTSWIDRVEAENIIFSLDAKELKLNLGKLKFYVSFHASRTHFRRCHFAVEQFRENKTLDLTSLLFPIRKNNFKKPKIELRQRSLNELKCFYPKLNVLQKTAVLNILEHVARPSPYIIFGPPGTGKTVTFCEAILQVYDRTEQTKILVCGNTNASADIIATKILESRLVPKDEFVRLTSYSRMNKFVEEHMQESTRHIGMMDKDDILYARVIVSTINNAGVLHGFGHRFDYVFIDEAGHATEPETLIPINLLKPDGSLVLAGDFKQLGPVCFSKIAKTKGLAKSLLERLSELPLYSQSKRNGVLCYDGRYMTKLLLSYRSDPRVMAVNNELFYKNELKFVVTTPRKYMKLLKIKKPNVFHQIRGKERRDTNDPSWFNGNETIIILGYAQVLTRSGLKPEELGVVTPYRRQIAKLRKLFKLTGLDGCKIGTTEEFQGDEREVIIVSTVRAQEDLIKFDQKFMLGFIFEKKRFNVTTSRAKWHTIVVGDYRILKRDPNWLKFIENAHQVNL